jgi:hypothetical protein
MFARIAAATGAVPDDALPVERLRAGLSAYLEFLVAEPEFARVFLVEILAAGPRGLEQQARAHERFATLNRAWHQQARRRHGWPAAPPEAYMATVGAVHELVFTRVRNGRIDSVLELAPVLPALVLSLLQARPDGGSG